MATQRKASLEKPGEDGDSKNVASEKKDIPLPEIVDIERAPAFLIDNKHLRRGYRKNYRRIPDILASLFRPHNETLNIWTHLIGSIVAMWALIFVMGNQTPFDAIGPKAAEHLQSPATQTNLTVFWQHLSVCPNLERKASDLSVSRVVAEIKDLHTRSAAEGLEYVDMRAQHELNQGILATACGYLGWMVQKDSSLSVVRLAEELIFGLSHKLASTAWEFRYIRDKLVSSVRLA